MNNTEAKDFATRDHNRIETEVLENGIILETAYVKGAISTRKYIKPDSSYEVYNDSNYKTVEQTADGIFRIYKYQSTKIDREIYPDKTIITYHDNGNVSTITKADKTYVSYYDNGNMHKKSENDYELALFKDGRLQYEFKDGKLTINPEFFSYYRIGMKCKDAPNHWTEQGTLDPSRKTLLCLGGDQTRNAKEANGNINVFANVLGLTKEQLDTMQLCSCYRPSVFEVGILHLVKKSGDYDDKSKQDYRREILQKFMPFMATIKNGEFKRYSEKQLYKNFRNIIIQAHCYGANDLPIISEVFKDTMAQLGYSKDEITKALKQVICITNNSQREFKDNLGFTTFHRYSVKDGQFDPEYEHRYSAGYPVFLQRHEKYNKKKGQKAAFVSLRRNEALMIFDRVLLGNDEHNSAFWTTTKKLLTPVGKQQEKLMENIGRFWYSNVRDVPDVVEILEKCSQGTNIRMFVEKALANGRKLATEQRNPLINHDILKSEKNKLDDNIVPDNFGIFKVLAEKYNKSK